MDFNDTPEEAEFRQSVRTFLKEELPERFKTEGNPFTGGGDMRSRSEEMKE